MQNKDSSKKAPPVIKTADVKKKRMTIDPKASLSAMGSMAVGAGVGYVLDENRIREILVDSDKDNVAETVLKDENHDGVYETSEPLKSDNSGAEPVSAEVVEDTPSADYASFNPSTAPHASTVNETMSFKEAFASARHELGAGGVFMWHGNAYSTFYAEEVPYSTSLHDSDSNAYASHEGTADQSYSDSNHETGYHQVNSTDNNSSGQEVEVDIIGVDANQDGAVEAIVMDINHDASADVVYQDLNNDGVISENEAVVIHDPSTLQESANHSDGSMIRVDSDGDGIDDILVVDANHDHAADSVEIQNAYDDNAHTATASEMDYDGEISSSVPPDVSDEQLDVFTDDVAGVEDSFGDEQSWT